MCVHYFIESVSWTAASSRQ